MAISHELLLQLSAIGLSESDIFSLSTNDLDTAAALSCVTKEELEVIGLKVGARNKIKAAFPFAHSGDTLNVEVSAVGSAASSPVVKANPYAYLLSDNQNSIGFSSHGLNPRINPVFIRTAAKAASVFVIAGTGIFNLFSKREFWRLLQLEDMQLRGRINRWTENFRTGQYISDESLEELSTGVSALFGRNFECLVSTAGQLSSQLSALQLLGDRARLDVGSDAAAYAQLQNLLPLAAEEISQRMISSPIPEQTFGLDHLLTDLLDILKDPRLQSAGGVNAENLEQGAILFLQRQFGSEIANCFRLALAYESLLNALAACPPTAETSYLAVFGTLASQVCLYFKAVEDFNSTTVPRREYSGSDFAKASDFRFKFSISLQVRH